MPEKLDEINKRLTDAINLDDIPNIYFNGFTNTIGLGDIVISIERNGKPVAVLNASYTVAKTLALKLNGLIQNLENTTGNKIMTTDDVEQKFKAQRN